MEKPRRAAERDTGSKKREAIDALPHRAERAAGAQALSLEMALQEPWMPVFSAAIKMTETEEKEGPRLQRVEVHNGESAKRERRVLP